MCRDVVSVPKGEFQSAGKVYDVTFLTSDGSGTTIQCPDDKYILDAAEEQGLDLPCTCRGGICGTCVARIAEGTVDASDIADLSFTLDDDQIKAGMALICMTRAQSDLKIETQCDWGMSLGFEDWKGASGKLKGEVNPLMGKRWTEMTDAEKAVASAAGVAPEAVEAPH